MGANAFYFVRRCRWDSPVRGNVAQRQKGCRRGWADVSAITDEWGERYIRSATKLRCPLKIKGLWNKLHEITLWGYEEFSEKERAWERENGFGKQFSLSHRIKNKIPLIHRRGGPPSPQGEGKIVVRYYTRRRDGACCVRYWHSTQIKENFLSVKTNFKNDKIRKNFIVLRKTLDKIICVYYYICIICSSNILIGEQVFSL